jgi:hypothetical protein
MPTEFRAEPYERIDLGDGRNVPWYMIPFDKSGICQAPQTRDQLIDEAGGGYTDVFIFSHGWNNDWQAATSRYRSFIQGYGGVRRERAGASGTGTFTPLLVGLFWPSTILVMPGERPPVIAGLPGEAARDAVVGEEQRELRELVAELAPGDRSRAYELLQQEALDEKGARSLAKLLAPLTASADDELGEGGDPLTEDELVEVWRLAFAESPPDSDDAGTDWGTVAGASAPARAAGGFSLDPRALVRALTVRGMKDRAGVVGQHGACPLVRDLLGAGGARLHLIGHSYGAKVCLSALAVGALKRPVASLLLLQPAVNHQCFASRVEGLEQPGGYRGVLAAVEQPIVTTYSRHDGPLTKYFHLALTRPHDLQEFQIAGWPEPPSRFAALGGFGPGGAESETVWLPLKDVGDRYGPEIGDRRIVAIDATAGISDHGDVSNRHTWWALYDQVTRQTGA